MDHGCVTKWTKDGPPVEQPNPEPGLSPYQQAMRQRLLAAPAVQAPEPWRRIAYAPVGELLGIGFASHPDTGEDLVMVVSHDGHGLFDAVTGEKIARDRDPDLEAGGPDADPALRCPGLGPVAGSRVRIAGLFGGGLHTTAETVGRWRSLPRAGRTSVSCSLATAVCRTPVRTVSAGGTSSTPTTPNSVPLDSRPPDRPLP